MFGLAAAVIAISNAVPAARDLNEGPSVHSSHMASLCTRTQPH